MPRKDKGRVYALLIRQELLPDFIAPDCYGHALICELKWGSQVLMRRQYHLEWRPGRPEGQDVWYRGKYYKWIEEERDAALLFRADFRSFALDVERLLQSAIDT